jgi:hypothetical protein
MSDTVNLIGVKADGSSDFLGTAPMPPCDTLTAEEASNKQHWKGMDGACAFHLIERHANGWGDVGRMMDAWLQANREPPNAKLTGPSENQGSNDEHH